MTQEIERSFESMENRRGFLRRIFGGAIAATITTWNRALAATNYSVTARSGEELPCHSYYRVDANGKEWPTTIRVTVPPKNGTVQTRVYPQPVSTPVGSKVVKVTRVFYKSKVAFSGSDSFAYRRITADPTDTTSGEEFVVAVTVR
jgi:hypothetical protein